MRFTRFLQVLSAFTVFLLGAGAISAQAADHESDPATGLWLTQNERAVINVTQCDEGLCGHIYWIIEGGMQTDANNPDEALRDRAMCGLKILWGFDHDAPGEWGDGHIYKADEGDTYSANVALKDYGRLKLRGYIGVPMLGKTQYWTRAAADDYPACE